MLIDSLFRGIVQTPSLIGRLESVIYVVFNAPENSKTERGGLNFVDPEK